MSVSFVFLPVSVVFIPVLILEYTFSVFLMVLPVSVVERTVYKRLFTFSVLFIRLPSTVINITILPLVHSLSISKTLFEVSFKSIASRILEYTVAVKLAFSIAAFVEITISIIILSLTLQEIPFHITFIKILIL